MAKRTLKQGFEFSLDGHSVYKITKLCGSYELDGDNRDRFLAIWIGTYSERDMTTYYGHIRYGDFRSDNALLERRGDGKIVRVQEATGMIGLSGASQEYREAIGR